MKQRLGGEMPEFEGPYYIHSTACVIGNVHCGKYVSVWPNAVLRGDYNRVEVGEYVNIQDGAILHNTLKYSVRVGNNVTVGHNAVLHSCEVGEGSLIGIGALILDGSVIGKNCMIGAGAVIPPHTKIEDNSVVVGNPGRVIRQITPEESADNLERTRRYWNMALEYIKTADVY